MNRRVLIGCGAGLFIALCVLCIGIVAMLFWYRAAAPKDVTITVSAPESVPVGEPFAVEVQVTNVYTDVQTLDSIDISNSYLEAIRVASVSPPASDEFEIPVVQYYSYTFDEELDMLASMTVLFEMVGEVEGEYAGQIDVCINNGSDCRSFEVSTTVGVTGGR